MKYLTQDEINALATKFITLRDQANQSEQANKNYKIYQNFCVEQLKFLVRMRAAKYRKFPNYQDLEQDGFEALILALKTYNPSKGCFSWWADKYIKTRISRAANSHSTIRFPLAKAKEMKPHKVSVIPPMTDLKPNASESLENFQNTDRLIQAVCRLPMPQQQVITMVFGLNGIESHSVGALTKSLSLSRPQCLRLIEDAKEQLKKILNSEI